MENACIYYLGQRSIPVNMSAGTIGSDSGGRSYVTPPELECIKYLINMGYTMMKYPKLKGINDC